jgi:hypothetical protein
MQKFKTAISGHKSTGLLVELTSQDILINQQNSKNGCAQVGVAGKT